MMNRYRIYKISLCMILLSIAFSLKAQNAQVFISEIMYDTPLNEQIGRGIDYSNGEYIKISNVYKRTLDLSGWTLSGGGKSEKLVLEQGTVIPPRGHIIFAYQHKDKNTQKLFTLDQLYLGLLSAEPQLQIIYQRKILLSNSGESIVLRDSTGLKRDSIYYDGTSNPNKVNRLEAINANNADGNECFSLQRIQTNFDFHSCAETNNSHWTKVKVNPSGFAAAYQLPEWEEEECTTSDNYNYVKVRNFTSQDGKQFLDEVDYYDGLGRQIEKVQRNVTSQKEDLVYFQKYDHIGRLSTIWLPTTSIGNGTFVTEQQIATKACAQYKDQNPYKTNIYEDSPIENLVTICGEGQNWHQNQKFVHQNRYVNDNYLYTCIHFETTNKGVKQIGKYQRGQLIVFSHEDEDGHLTYEFHDKQERLILSRTICGEESHDTYYIYDDRQNLTYVLPPLLIDSIGEELSDDAELMKQYAYVYKYDNRNRCIEKRLPGCDWCNYIYDSADKLIFSQDGELRNKGICQFFLYDTLQRLVLDGYCKMPSNTELDFIRMNPINVTACYDSSTVELADVDTTLCNKYHYLLKGIQLNRLEAVSCNYYDNYELLNHIPNKEQMSYDANEESFNTRWESEEYSEKGLLTAQITGVLGETASSTSFYYYDFEKRQIQTKKVNEDGTDFQTEYYKYDFLGNVTSKLSKYWDSIHKVISGLQPEIKELYSTTYDHAGRAVECRHQLNDGKEISLCRNEYDELSRLKSKTLREDQDLRIEFGYNVRSALNSLQSNHFKQQLFYEDRFEPFRYHHTPLYGGCITGMTWQIFKPGNKQYQNLTRAYTYSYDDKSRLVDTQYLEGEYYVYDQAFFSTNYQYDKHGNITSLYREGNETTGYDCGTIDDLKFDYSGNQLVKVQDEAFLNSRYFESEDFRDRVDIPVEYQYNKNGSIISDLNRYITSIKYNYLSLPESIEFDTGKVAGSIHYKYSSDGTKLSVIHKVDSIPGSTKISTTKYVGNKVYEDGRLKYILFNEGYIEDGKYYFFLTDYLGNNRVVVGPDSIIQQMHYYPFGASYAESVGVEAQPYKFGGKECDKTVGMNIYDFSARFYQPDLGRFMMIDPKCENSYAESPYVYCANNPIKNIDPDGRDWRVQTQYNKNTGKIEYHMSVNAVLYNNSSNQNIDMAKLATSITQQINDVYSISGDGFVSKMNFKMRVVNSVDEIGESDHVFRVVNQKELDDTYSGRATPGQVPADSYGFDVRISSDFTGDIISGSSTRTMAHELGHTGGLPDLNGNIKENRDRLMMQADNVFYWGGIPNKAIGLPHNDIKMIRDNYINNQFKYSSPIIKHYGKKFISRQ